MKIAVTKTFFLFIITLLIVQCKKEDDTIYPDKNPPEGYLNIIDGKAEYNYGDTLFLEGQVTTDNLPITEIKLTLDGNKIYSTSSKLFTYQIKRHGIYTYGLSIGTHKIVMTATDHFENTVSDSVSFNIKSISPSIETTEISGLVADSAIVMGRYKESGGYAATWGICYNTSGSPKKEENTLYATDSLFEIKLSGLKKLTKYFVRTWISNKEKTEYGEEIMFKTSDETGVFFDARDNKQYRWVKIGTQTWMAENLAYLPFLRDQTKSDNLDSGIYVYNFPGINVSQAKQTINYKTYGALYSWEMAKEMCPAGWHLPDTNELEVLIDYLGGEELAGGKLKTRGTGYWNTPNNGATNESGFSALPGGVHLNGEQNIFNYLGFSTRFWMASENSEKEDRAAILSLSHSKQNTYKISFSIKQFGHPIRCIKD